MVALQIRDVPDHVRDRLAAKAAAQGQSLQAFLLAVVEREATLPTNLEIIARVRALGGGSHVTRSEAADVIHEARREAGRE